MSVFKATANYDKSRSRTFIQIEGCEGLPVVDSAYDTLVGCNTLDTGSFNYKLYVKQNQDGGFVDCYVKKDARSYGASELSQALTQKEAEEITEFILKRLLRQSNPEVFVYGRNLGEEPKSNRDGQRNTSSGSRRGSSYGSSLVPYSMVSAYGDDMDYEIDTRSLRRSLIDYYGRASGPFPVAQADLVYVEGLSDRQLIRYAETHGFDLSRFIIYTPKESQSSRLPRGSIRDNTSIIFLNQYLQRNSTSSPAQINVQQAEKPKTKASVQTEHQFKTLEEARVVARARAEEKAWEDKKAKALEKSQAEAKARAAAKAKAEAKAKADAEARAAAKAKKEEARAAAKAKAEYEAEQARIREEKARAKAKAKKVAIAVAGIAIALLLTVFIFIPGLKYSRADKMVEAGQYDQAIEAYRAIEESEKRNERICAAYYAHAEALLDQEEYEQAVKKFKKAGSYKDAIERTKATHYAHGEALLEANEFEQAVKQFQMVSNYADAKLRVKATYYAYGEYLLEQEDFEQAADQFKKASDYEDAKERIEATHYAYAEKLFMEEKYEQAVKQFNKADNYRDAEDQAKAASYAHAEQLLSKKLFTKSAAQFEELGDYKDAPERVLDVKYQHAQTHVAAHQRYEAYLLFKTLGSYQDAAERASQLKKELEQSLSIRLVYFNTDKHDTSTVLRSISNKGSYLSYGYKVEGLHPKEKIRLVYTYTWPGKNEKLADWTWEDVKSGEVVECIWEDGYNTSDNGTLKIEIHIFDDQESVSDTGKPIGQFSISVQKPADKSSGQSWGMSGSSTIVSSTYGNSIW